MANEKIELSDFYGIDYKGQPKKVHLQKGNYKCETCDEKGYVGYVEGYFADYGYGLYMVNEEQYNRLPSNDASWYRYGKFKIFELVK